MYLSIRIFLVLNHHKAAEHDVLLVSMMFYWFLYSLSGKTLVKLLLYALTQRPMYVVLSPWSECRGGEPWDECQNDPSPLDTK